jgi:hypothetical protein
VPFFLNSLLQNLGILTVVGYMAGLCYSITSAGDRPVDVDVFVATSLAMLVIPMIVPADLDQR